MRKTKFKKKNTVQGVNVISLSMWPYNKGFETELILYNPKFSQT
jgi:hypothetical protein